MPPQRQSVALGPIEVSTNTRVPYRASAVQVRRILSGPGPGWSRRRRTARSPRPPAATPTGDVLLAGREPPRLTVGVEGRDEKGAPDLSERLEPALRDGVAVERPGASRATSRTRARDASVVLGPARGDLRAGPDMVDGLGSASSTYNAVSQWSSRRVNRRAGRRRAPWSSSQLLRRRPEGLRQASDGGVGVKSVGHYRTRAGAALKAAGWFECGGPHRRTDGTADDPSVGRCRHLSAKDRSAQTAGAAGTVPKAWARVGHC